ncbi:MAG: hypothetical protein ABIS38_08825 [Sphingomicrobium sp.]
MARDTRKFELQFQWEVDRLVFRHRQRGLPIEVTEEERDRLVERYAARLKLAQQALFAGLLGGAMLVGLLSKFVPDGVYVGFALYGAMIVSLITIDRWCFDGTTATLRRRKPIGEPLGTTGAFVRTIAGIAARDLWMALAYAAVLGVLVSASFGGEPTEYWTIAIFVFVVIVLIVMLILKGALHERDRLRKSQSRLIERSRELRTD